jgi:exosortase D (VPLPA-CTERM-specific)
MNSFRIGAIGVMVEYWGIEMAEGFLHDFEGWVIFMACMAVLLLEMWILLHIGRERKPLRAAFGIDMPEQAPEGVQRIGRKLPYLYLPSVILVLLLLGLSQTLPEREEIIPDREPFAGFPIQVEGWKGRVDTMEPIYLDALKLDDYLLSDYSNGQQAINLYMAYYASQRRGESAHSPRTCIPGGGWKINSITAVKLDDPRLSDLTVNRILIRKGELKQLGYYWFQGRGRVITNEYLVKWFIFWDSLTRRRSDGALIRLLTTIGPNENVAEAESQLIEFLADIRPLLDGYIPAETVR